MKPMNVKTATEEETETKPINIKTATLEQHDKLYRRAKSVGKTMTQFVKDWIDDDFKVRK